MKYLFLLLLVLLVIWAIKRTRAGQSSVKPPPAPGNNTPSEMVICAHCGIHLPQEEAVSGQQGLYCSTEHRAAAQDRNPS
jgi:uncharacterized protein